MCVSSALLLCREESCTGCNVLSWLKRNPPAVLCESKWVGEGFRVRDENPLLAASAAIPPSLPPDPHLAGFGGGHNYSTRLGKLLGTIFSIFKTVKQTFLLH